MNEHIERWRTILDERSRTGTIKRLVIEEPNPPGIPDSSAYTFAQVIGGRE